MDNQQDLAGNDWEDDFADSYLTLLNSDLPDISFDDGFKLSELDFRTRNEKDKDNVDVDDGPLADGGTADTAAGDNHLSSAKSNGNVQGNGRVTAHETSNGLNDDGNNASGDATNGGNVNSAPQQLSGSKSNGQANPAHANGNDTITGATQPQPRQAPSQAGCHESFVEDGPSSLPAHAMPRGTQQALLGTMSDMNLHRPARPQQAMDDWESRKHSL